MRRKDILFRIFGLGLAIAGISGSEPAGNSGGVSLGHDLLSRPEIPIIPITEPDITRPILNFNTDGRHPSTTGDPNPAIDEGARLQNLTEVVNATTTNVTNRNTAVVLNKASRR